MVGLGPMAGAAATQGPTGSRFRLPLAALSNGGGPDPPELSRILVDQGPDLAGSGFFLPLLATVLVV